MSPEMDVAKTKRDDLSLIEDSLNAETSYVKDEECNDTAVYKRDGRCNILDYLCYLAQRMDEKRGI